MGTRNLTCVVVDGQFKIAQYGQFDGYPSHMGVKVYSFAKTLTGPKLKKFRQQVRDLQETSDEEVEKLWNSFAVDRTGMTGIRSLGFAPLDVDHLFETQHYEYHRNCGADILNLVAKGKATSVKLSTSFAADSLFCEYCYVLDLDKRVMEVYCGFQTSPHNKGRFAGMPVKKVTHSSGDQYYPVAKVWSCSFSKLPRTKNQFIKLAEKACGADE